jgi:U6 snRNA-associated Sm-like protein LSm7
VGKEVIVKLTGGREVTGVLKGYDTMVNLVLDDCVETLRDAADPYKLTDETRSLGLLVCRGPSVMLVMPVEGRSETDNPWLAQEDAVI